MDKEKAKIVVLQNEEEHMETITSDMEFYNPKGGSRSKTRWGPQDVVQDSKYLEREKHQMRAYFKKLVPKLVDADKIALFGPANTIEKFNAELEENHKNISEKIEAVSKKDSMTDNQIKALMRDFFEGKGH